MLDINRLVKEIRRVEGLTEEEAIERAMDFEALWLEYNNNTKEGSSSLMVELIDVMQQVVGNDPRLQAMSKKQKRLNLSHNLSNYNKLALTAANADALALSMVDSIPEKPLDNFFEGIPFTIQAPKNNVLDYSKAKEKLTAKRRAKNKQRKKSNRVNRKRGK